MKSVHNNVVDAARHPFRSVALVMCCLVFLAACSANRSQGRQDISGRVTWTAGNQMPPSRSPGSQGIRRTLYIHEAALLSQVSGKPPLFDHISTTLVAKVRTNREGYFTLFLQPGKYSVFVKEGERYYANRFDGENYVQVITVKANEWAKINILVNYIASY
jgi:hypothetical protein